MEIGHIRNYVQKFCQQHSGFLILFYSLATFFPAQCVCVCFVYVYVTDRYGRATTILIHIAVCWGSQNSLQLDSLQGQIHHGRGVGGEQAETSPLPASE